MTADFALCAEKLPARLGRPTADAAAALEAHILDTAWSAALIHGADEFTLDQVAQMARSSKRTIYARFRNKQEMVLRMVERRLTDFLDAVHDRSPGLAISDALEMNAVISMRYMASPEGKVLARLIDSYSDQAPSDGETLRETSHRLACSGMEALFADGIARGEIRPLDARFAASFWLESLTGHARYSRQDVSDKELHDWARQHTALFLRGLCL
jgi:TetR/AcrR family transcriptional regulator, mexJK operon transcriptional repressor